MSGDKRDAMLAHIADCGVCSRANKRVNDFCDLGRFLFFDWNPQPISATMLDEQTSRRVIDPELARARKAGSN